jgi:hypothetical protein
MLAMLAMLARMYAISRLSQCKLYRQYIVYWLVVGVARQHSNVVWLLTMGVAGGGGPKR